MQHKHSKIGIVVTDKLEESKKLVDNYPPVL